MMAAQATDPRHQRRATALIAKMAMGALVLLLWVTATASTPSDWAEARSNVITNDQTLQTEIENYVADLGGTYGIAIENLDDGRVAFLNADSSFPAASMYKLLVMYRVFQEIDSGDLSPDDVVTIEYADEAETEPDEGLWVGDTLTVAEALDAMIGVSSNSAAYALTRTVGGWSEIASAAEELGMSSTTLDGYFFTTPADLLHFFELLSDRSLVSQSASDQMVQLLLGQEVNDRLPAQLPDEAQVAHKTGELPNVRNDGGLVQGPGGRYAIVVLGWGDPDETIPAEAQISRIVYDRYGGLPEGSTE